MIARILVALDESPRTEGVFDTAAEIANRFGAQLQPMRVITIPPEFPAAAAGSKADRLPAILSTAAVEALRHLADRAPQVAVLVPMVRAGEPWRCILEVSEELDVDLIVLGSHGYKGLDRVLGTTAAKVVNMANRDVLVVHARAVMPREGPKP